MTLIRHKARIVLSLFTLFVGGFSIAHLRGAEQTDSRPNFLFIIADDCTFRDIGCYGGQAITPNIDSLAQQGMRFTQCFQQAPMCSPTRHAIYTGIYPVKSGAYPNHTFVKDGTKSIAHYLEPLGYRVHLSGKTHINPKSSFPFEYSGKKNPDFKAIDQLLTESTRDGTPFCLFACSNEPHGPWNKGVTIRFIVPQYDSSTITAWNATLLRGYLVLSDGPVKGWLSYGAMVEYVDIAPTFDAAGGSREAAIDGMSFVPVLTGETNGHKRFVFGEMTTRGINKGSPYFGIRSIRSEKYKYIYFDGQVGALLALLDKHGIAEKPPWMEECGDQGQQTELEASQERARKVVKNKRVKQVSALKSNEDCLF